MRICPRLAVVRRQVAEFVALAEARAARADIRVAPSFRLLTEAEAEAIVGADLLAALSHECGQVGR